MHRRNLVFVSLVPLLAACEGLKRRDQQSRLDVSLKGYAGAIRWGNLDTAQGFVRPRDGAAQPAQDVQGLKVTGYGIRVVSVNESSSEAQVAMSFTYYFQDQGRVHTTEQIATWYYDEAGGVWLVDAPGLPDFHR